MRHRFALTCGALAILLAGCGESNRPIFQTTYPVRGRVVLAKGSPVPGGQLEFHPENPELPEARAAIKSDGTFVVGTYKVNDGAVPGRFTVTIDALVYDKAGNLRTSKSLPIPRKYADVRTSGLQVEIRAEPNEVTLRLN